MSVEYDSNNIDIVVANWQHTAMWIEPRSVGQGEADVVKVLLGVFVTLQQIVDGVNGTECQTLLLVIKWSHDAGCSYTARKAPAREEE